MLVAVQTSSSSACSVVDAPFHNLPSLDQVSNLFTMVSITSILAASIAVLASVASAVDLNSLEEGLYYRPEGDIVSAFPAATTEFRRTPCPALNTLANHGFLPRDGKNITKDIARKAITSKFNLDVAFVNILLGPLPETFDLNLLGTHGLIEHDGSIVHADSYYAFDPIRIDPELVQDALSRGDGKVFTVAELGALRRDRLAVCFATNPQCSFSARDGTIAFGEAALILDVLGGNQNSTITQDDFISFLVDEHFPTNYTMSPTVVSINQILTTSAKVNAVASAPKAL